MQGLIAIAGNPKAYGKTYGFSGFLQFVKAAQTRGLVTLTWDDDLEDYLLTV